MKLTRHGFMRWLRSKKGSDIVGSPQEWKDCPLAQYLGTGVTEEEYGDGPYGTGTRLAPWASDFVVAADKGRRNSITAKRALELLGEQP